MGIDDRIREIVQDELRVKMASIEKILSEHFKEEAEELKNEIGAILSQLESLLTLVDNIEDELSKKMSLMARLRKYTLDRVVSEYNKLLKRKK